MVFFRHVSSSIHFCAWRHVTLLLGASLVTARMSTSKVSVALCRTAQFCRNSAAQFCRNSANVSSPHGHDRFASVHKSNLRQQVGMCRGQLFAMAASYLLAISHACLYSRTPLPAHSSRLLCAMSPLLPRRIVPRDACGWLPPRDAFAFAGVRIRTP